MQHWDFTVILEILLFFRTYIWVHVPNKDPKEQYCVNGSPKEKKKLRGAIKDLVQFESVLWIRLLESATNAKLGYDTGYGYDQYKYKKNYIYKI